MAAKLFAFVCGIGSLVMVVSAVNDPVVDSIDTNRGSLAGGTMIYVRGRNFAESQFQLFDPNVGNRIVFRSDTHEVPCGIVPTGVSSTTVSCEIGPSPTPSGGEYELVMHVNGRQVTQYCGWRGKCVFTFDRWRTPTIDQVYPQGAVPGTPLTICGRLHTIQFSRLSPGFQPDGLENTRIYAGLECDPFNEETNELFGAELNDDCWAPTCHGCFTCLPKIKTAGSVSTSYLVSHRGRSQLDKAVPRVNIHHDTYTLQVYSDIQSVWPTSGSTEGGTELTIQGLGFTDRLDNIQVDVGGVPCEVLSSSLTEITCRTGQQPSVMPSVYAGSRGLFREIWTETFESTLLDIESLSTSAADYHSEIWTESRSPGDATFTSTSGYSSKITGFFVPPQNDYYTFYIKSYDRSDLFLSLTGNPADKTKIASCTQPTNDWNRVQKSDPIHLEAGGKYYVMVLHNCYDYTRDQVSIAVSLERTRYTNAELGAASDEQQQFTISSVVKWEKQILDFSNWDEDEKVYELQKISLQRLQCVENNFTSCENTTDNFTLCYHEECTTLSLQHTNSSILEEHLNGFSTIQSRGRVNVTAVNSSEANVTAFHVLYWFNDPRGVEILNGSNADNRTLVVNITRVEHGRAAQDFRLIVGNMPSMTLTPSSSIADIEDALEDWFSRKCDTSSKAGHIFYKHFEDQVIGIEYGERVSDYECFCGRFCLKNPSTIWKAYTTSYVNEEPDQTPYPINRYKWFCFAYKGPIHNQVKFQLKYNEGGEDHYTNRWYALDVPPSLSNWRFSCLDVWAKIEEEYGENVLDFEMNRIELSRVDGAEGDILVDEVLIGRNPYSVIPIENAAKPNGFIIKDFQVEKSSDKNWTISLWPADCGSPLPLLDIEDGVRRENSTIDSTVTAARGLNSSVQVMRIQAASPPVQGTFDIECGEGVKIEGLPFNITESQLQDRLEECEEGDIHVEITGDCGSSTYKITFISQGGNHPQVRVNGSGLSGIQVAVTVQTLQDGRLFMDPIPGEFWRLPSTEKQVVVTVNDLVGSCSGNDCSYDYSSLQTPQITSISPTSGPGGTEITISGSGFATENDQNTVTIGGSNCDIISSAADTISCQAGYGPGGSHIVHARVRGKGFAANTQNTTFTYTIVASSVSSSAGSTAGGHVIIISGIGFGITTKNASVSLNGSLCEILHINMSSIECRTSAHAPGRVSVEINVDDSSASLADAYEYDSSLTALVNNVSPRQGSVSGGEEITIFGSGFLPSTTVQLGDEECVIQNITEMQIVCVTPSHSPGKFPILVTYESGSADMPDALDEFEFVLEVHDICPLIGSMAGGTRVTVTGRGFSSDVSRNDVTVLGRPCAVTSSNWTVLICETPDNYKRHTIDNSGTHPELGRGYKWKPERLMIKPGDTVEWSWVGQGSYVVYQTSGASSTVYDGSGFRSQRSSTGTFTHRFMEPGEYYYAGDGSVVMKGVIIVRPVITENGTISVQTAGFEALYNNTSTPDPSSTCGTGRIDAVPGCTTSLPAMGSNPDHFSFTYWACSTPSVFSVAPAEGTSDSVITVQGNGFSNTSWHNKVSFGSHVCDVSFSNDSTIVCQLSMAGSPQAGEHREVSVQIDNRGYAFVTNGQTHFVLKPSIATVSPSEGSKQGGTRITISGLGFSENNVDNVVRIGDDECTVMESSFDSIVCITQASTDENTLEVAVSVGGSDSECTASDCEFTFTTASTPVVSSVSPSTITSTNTELRFSVSRLTSSLSDVTVTVGNEPCQVTLADKSSQRVKCDLPGIVVGNHTVIIHVSGKGNALFDGAADFVLSEAIQPSVSPQQSSINGGLTITIAGNGFNPTPGQTTVSIGDEACEITNVTYGEITCVTPPHTPDTSVVLQVIVNQNPEGASRRRRSVSSILFPTTTLAFTNAATPQVTSLSSSTGKGGDTLTIAGNGLDPLNDDEVIVYIGDLSCAVTNSQADSVSCTLAEEAAGTYSVEVLVPGKGLATSGFSFTYSLSIDAVDPIESGFGGGRQLVIQGCGFDASAVVQICGNECSLNTSHIATTEIACEAPMNPNYASVGDQQCDVQIEVNGMSSTLPGGFTYKSALTSVIDSVTPSRGGTGGGTSVIITGSGFSSTQSENVVSIDGTPCIVSFSSSTRIECTTGEHGRTIETKVRVDVGDNGKALDENGDFFYVDVWSSRFTWGYEDPPIEGDFVVIKKDQTILLDQDTPVFKMLLIQGGKLIFDREQPSLHLQAQNILITDNGELQVGTEDDPFPGEACITLHGHVRSREIPVFGTKSLSLREGTLDLHGLPVRITWTHISTTAEVNSTVLHLTQQVTWKPGDQIVLAPTGKSQREYEELTITAVVNDNYALHVTPPLMYKHISIVQTFDGHVVETRAEVGLLTRNVKVKGSVHPQWEEEIEACEHEFAPGQFQTQTCFQGKFGDEIGSDEFGATIMIHAPERSKGMVTARFSYVEIFHAGQAFRLGRYPIHFHLSGDVSGSYVRGCAVHHSFNRAITMHGIDNLHVSHNVIFNVKGNAFFMEDGIETGNIVEYNLGIFVTASSSSLNVDITPATFWVTNANNTVRHNAAAGGSHFGFWYQMFEHPDGPSFTPHYCPRNVFMVIFFNNSAHSFGRYGLWIFPTYHPQAGGQCDSHIAEPAVFRTFLAYNNMRGAEAVQIGAVQMQDFKVLDNDIAGFEYVFADTHDAPWGGPMIKDSLIVGHSEASAGLELKISSNTDCTTAGIRLPQSSKMTVENVTFVNFNRPSCTAYRTCAQCKEFKKRGGWTTRARQNRFVDSPNRVFFEWSHEAVIVDLDGSLTGFVNGSIVPTIANLPPQHCNHSVQDSHGPHSGSNCDGNVKFTRFGFNNAFPESLQGKMASFRNQYGTDSVPFSFKAKTHPFGWMSLLICGETYEMFFENATQITNISYSGAFYELDEDCFLWINHSLTQRPDHFTTTGAYQNMTEVFPPFNARHGNWSFVNETKVFTYLVSGRDGRRTDNNNIEPIHTELHVYRCKYEDCITPVPPPPPAGRPANPKLWSNVDDWLGTEFGYGGYGRTLPHNGSDVVIQREWYMLADMQLPYMNKLFVYGTLEIQDQVDGVEEMVLNVSILFVSGGVIVGWPHQPYVSRFCLSLQGDWDSEDLPTNDVNVGSKAVGVFGFLWLHGQPKDVYWTRLGRTANAGDSMITLAEPVLDWRINDQIVISSTSVEPQETETFYISGISSDRRNLTLNGTLQYQHLGEEYSVMGRTYSLAAEVGLLTRNIKIEGADNPSGAWGQSFGGRVLIGQTSSDGIEYTGSARIENVEFYRCGQEGWTDDYDPRFGLTFLDIGDVIGNESYVRGNSFHHCFNTGIGVFGTNNLSIEDNVVHHTVGSAIKVAGSWNRVCRNLAVYSISIHTYNGRSDKTNVHWPGAIESIKALNVKLINNTVAGSERFGFKIDGEICTEYSVTCLGSGNVVHGAWHGIHLAYAEGIAECTMICGFVTWRNYDYGVFTYAKYSLVIRDVTSVENPVGLFPNVWSPHALSHETADKFVIVQNTLIVATSPSYDCAAESYVPYARRPYSNIGAKKAPGGGKIGITMSFFGSSPAAGPVMTWESPMDYPAINGYTLYENVSFAAFEEKCGKRHRAIMTNSWVGDILHPMEVRGLRFDSTDEESMVFYDVPALRWVNPSDCVDMDCDARRQSLIKDMDGSLTGTAQTTIISKAEYEWDGDLRFGLGDYRIPKPALTDPDGNRLNTSDVAPNKGIIRGRDGTSKCSWFAPWNAYTCNSLNHKMLAVESLDEDTETRRLSPVALIGEGYINLLNGPMDHGWCLGYTCQERISTFYGIVATGVNYSLYFTSNEPQHQKLHLLNSEEDDCIRIGMFYQRPQRQDVYRKGVYIVPQNADLGGADFALLPKPPGAPDDYFEPQLTSHSGANYYDRDLATLFITVCGPEPVEIRVVPIVMAQVGMRGVSEDDFFKENLVSNLAALLGIDSSRIRIVNIVRDDGSRRRRSAGGDVSIVEIELGDPPVAANSSASNYTGANQTTSREELSELGDLLVEKVQTGELAEQSQTEVVSLSVTDPVPAPVDPTGGVRATNGTGGPNVTDNSTLRYDEVQSQAEEEAPGNVFSYLIPARLVLVTEPGGGNETVPFTLQPRLKVVDIDDQLVTTLGHGSLSNWTVTASIQNGTGDPLALLEGNVSVTIVDGWANFTDLSITHNGSDYRLVFNVSKPTTARFNATSQTFEVKERIMYFTVTAQPADANETVSFGTQPSIEVRDAANGQIIDNTGWKGRQWLFRASLANPEDNDGHLNGTTEVQFVRGVAQFVNLSVDISGEDYILSLEARTAPSSRYVFSTNSLAFNVSERAFYLKLVQQPGDCNDTVICGQQPKVEVRTVYPDALVENIGWRGRTWYINATMEGISDSVLNGSSFLLVPTEGRVEFHDLNFYDVAQAYQIRFTVETEPPSSYSGLSVTSQQFDVSERQFYLHVITQPGRANQSELFGVYPVVEIRDVGTGMRASPLKGDWSINVTLKTNGLNGTMSGVLNVTVQDERVQFTNLSVSYYGVGYVLTFESNYGHLVESQPFEVRYVNDFSPVFDPPTGVYNATISEDAAIGTSVATATATDQDTGSQGEVSFSIVAGNTENKFQVDSTTGLIETIGELDRETTASFTLTVRASDGAVAEKVRYTDGTVEVAISDINDNPPSFNTSSIGATVGEDAGIGDVITTLQASDPDEGANAAVLYAITSGNDLGLFFIDNTTGEVKVNSSLDLDQEPRPDLHHFLGILAEDMGSPSLDSNVTLNITISNVNEFTPQLLHEPAFNFSFEENAPVGDGVYVVQVNASDQDYGDQGRVSFAISSGNDEGKFVLNASTGVLELNSSLDYENTPFHTLVIHVRDNDNAGNVRFVEYTVYVTVIDINDNPPTFSQDQYEVTIDEDTAVGSIVFTFLADDPDGGLNGLVSYTIVSSNFTEFWTVNSSNGELKVNASLDMDSRNMMEWSHTLVVMAQDAGTPLLHSNASLVVTIVLTNEFAPTFASPDVSVIVSENIGIGSFVYQAIATDADYGPDGELRYLITDGNDDLRFFIDSRSGNITTDAELDRETQDGYDLTVTARDSPASGPKKSGTTTVHLSLRDVNDNSPSFAENFYSQLVNENVSIGGEVLSVQATDADLGTNGDLIYSITSGNERGLFMIEPIQGIIRADKSLDLETQNHTADFTYNLVVFVTDQGTPHRLNNSVSVTLSVQSVNEFAPVLQHAQDVVIELSENTTVSTVIYDVNATDDDYGSDGILTYVITQGNSFGTFAIDNVTGIITLAKELDYETISQHDLHVTVSDSGQVINERRTVTARIEIAVININDSEQYSTEVRLLQASIASPSNPAALAGVPIKTALEILLVYENGTTTDISRETDRFTLDHTSKSNNLFTSSVDDGIPYVLANVNGLSGEGKLVVHVTNVGTVEVNVTVVGSSSLSAKAVLYPEVPGAAEVSELKQVIMGSYQRVLLKVFLNLTNGGTVEVSNLQNTSFSVVNSLQVGGTLGFGPVPPNLFFVDGSGLSGDVILQAAFSSHLSNIVNLTLSSTILQVVAISRLGLHDVNSTFSGVAKVQKAALFAEVQVEGGSIHLLENVSRYTGLLMFSSSDPTVASVDPSTGVVTLLSESSSMVTITAALSGNSSVSAEFAFYCNLEPDVGEVDIGATVGPAIPSLNVGEIWRVPVRLNPGTRGMLALHVEIWFDDNDVYLVNMTVDLPHSVVSNTINIFGPLEEAQVLSDYVGELVFSAQRSGAPNVTVTFFRTVDTEMSVKPPRAPSSCGNAVLGDVNLDCSFDIVDVGFIGAYIASSKSQFQDTLGTQMRGLTLEQKTAMDVNWNEAIEHDDAVLLSRIYLGMAKFVTELTMQIPNHGGASSDQCSLEFTVKLANKDGSQVVPPQGDVYFFFSHNSAQVQEQLTQTDFTRGTKLELATVDGLSSIIGVVKASNDNGRYTITAVTSKLQSGDIGVFLVQLVTFNGQMLVVPMFLTSNPTYTTDVDVNFDNSLRLQANGGYAPQRVLQFSESTERCNDPFVTVTLEIVFEGDYDTLVSGKEERFAITVNRTLSQLYPGAVFFNFQFRKGSIVTSFNMTVPESEKDPAISKLWTDVQAGLKVDFDGAALTTLPILKANGDEFTKKAVDPTEDDGTPIYVVVIACVAAFVVLLVIIFVVYLLQRRKADGKVNPSPPQTPDSYDEEKTDQKYISAPSPPQFNIYRLSSASPMAFDERGDQIFEENEITLVDTPVLTSAAEVHSPPPRPVLGFQAAPRRLNPMPDSSRSITPVKSLRSTISLDEGVSDGESSVLEVSPTFTPRPSSSPSTPPRSASPRVILNAFENDGMLDEEITGEEAEEPVLRRRASSVDREPTVFEIPGLLLESATKIKYQRMQVKVIRPNPQLGALAHVAGIVKVRTSGSLDELRHVINSSIPRYLGAERYLFLSRKFKIIDPRTENQLIVSGVYKTTVYVKVFHGTENCEHFCQCGKVAITWCAKCNVQGYCGEDCRQEDEASHVKKCSKKKSSVIESYRTQSLTRKESKGKP